MFCECRERTYPRPLDSYLYSVSYIVRKRLSEVEMRWKSLGLRCLRRTKKFLGRLSELYPCRSSGYFPIETQSVLPSTSIQRAHNSSEPEALPTICFSFFSGPLLRHSFVANLLSHIIYFHLQSRQSAETDLRIAYPVVPA